MIGHFFRPDGTISTVFPTEVLREAATVAHDAGGRITMHCMKAETVEQAVAAGFDAVEHGTMMTAELVAEMAARSMTWVPTLAITQPPREMIGSRAAADAADILAGLDAHAGMVALAAPQGGDHPGRHRCGNGPPRGGRLRDPPPGDGRSFAPSGPRRRVVRSETVPRPTPHRGRSSRRPGRLPR